MHARSSRLRKRSSTKSRWWERSASIRCGPRPKTPPCSIAWPAPVASPNGSQGGSSQCGSVVPTEVAHDPRGSGSRLGQPSHLEQLPVQLQDRRRFARGGCVVAYSIQRRDTLDDPFCPSLASYRRSSAHGRSPHPCRCPVLVGFFDDALGRSQPRLRSLVGGELRGRN